MALAIDSKSENEEPSHISRLRPDSPQSQLSLSPGSGQRSSFLYDEVGSQSHGMVPRTSYGVASDFHVASFTKPIQTTSYSLGVYTQPSVAWSAPSYLNASVPSTMTLLPGPSVPLSPTLDSQSSSFTHTFLQGILSSIDSKDPIVANAWLETLLDAIDLLPPEVVKRDIIIIAVNKAQIEQATSSKMAACRILGKIAGKLDPQTIRQEILPAVLALCQDAEFQVRHCMCSHLSLIAKGLPSDIVEVTLLPQLIDLGHDKNCEVRLAAMETVVQLLGNLDKELCIHTIVPLVIKTCDQAKRLEDKTLPKIGFLFGRLCHGLKGSLTTEKKSWFIHYFRHLSQLGLPPNRDTSFKKAKSNDPMPDLLPTMEMDKSELYSECRLHCAFNFPAMVVFAEPSNFVDMLYPAFVDLASDPSWNVRQTLALGLHEVAKIAGPGFNFTKMEICNLFSDSQIDVLEAMVSNMVHVIDSLARHGVLQFAGQGGKYSHDLSRSLLKCEESISQTRNWRLQADCLEKFSCLANCISPVTIMQSFIPLLFERIRHTRTLPCRVAAARTLLVILRFTVKVEDRSRIIYRIQNELANGKSCHTRMLFLRLCEMAMSLFSKQYFKRNFFESMVFLAKDGVPNVRLKLCGALPRLKSLLSLPSDRSLLQKLEDTIKDMLLREHDTDVLFAVQKAIQDLDTVETGVDGVPSMNAEEDRENERKLREERLIASMEEQLYKSANTDFSSSLSPTKNLLPVNGGERLRYLTPSPPASSSTSPLAEPRRRRSESLPPPQNRSGGYDTFSSLMQQTPQPLRTYQTELSSYATAYSEREYSSKNWRKSRDFNHHPYSLSLDNLDPSAKEFLVDAGIILDKSSILTNVSSSMPNLSKHKVLMGIPITTTSADMATSESSGPKGVMEGEFSKYLISNEEMEQYEAEYQRCANALASGNSDPAALANGATSISKQKTDVSTTVHHEGGILLPPADKLLSISSLAQSTFTKLAASDALQGSIERLAEKWESKRKSLTDDSNDGLDIGSRQQRSSLVEQNKLMAYKQQALPKRRSLLKSPREQSASSVHSKLAPVVNSQRSLTAKKRLSLTDHVGAVSQQAMQKLINRKSLNSNEMMIGYHDLDDKNEVEESLEDRRINKLKGFRRFASFDSEKLEDNRYEDVGGYSGPSSYISSVPKTVGIKTQPNNNSHFYYALQGSGSNGGNRTLPQPPRSLPMTPGTNSNGSRMMFIPSKPFNNLFNNNQQQQSSPLSSSAPPSSGGRGVTLSPTSSREFRQQASRPLSASNKPVGDGAVKSKIVSPYIVSAESSSTRQSCDDQFGPHSPRNSPITSSVGNTPKASRLQPTSRYRPQAPSSAPQTKRPVSTTTARVGSKPQTPTQSGFKQQYGKSLSAESILSIEQFEEDGEYGVQPQHQRQYGSSGQGYSSGQGEDFHSKNSSESDSKSTSTTTGVRRSSGARMWHGQTTGAGIRQRSQEGRAPQASNSSLPPQPTSRPRPLRGQDSFGQAIQPSRTSYTPGPSQSSYQSKVNGLRSRPSSLHSSPGSSRPGSPQTVTTHSSKVGPTQHQPAARRTTSATRNTSGPSLQSATSSTSTLGQTYSRTGVQPSQTQRTATHHVPPRRQNSQNSGLPQPSSTQTNYSARGQRSGSNLTRQSSQQGGLPAPGFTGRSNKTDAKQHR